MIDEQRQALSFEQTYNHFKAIFKIIPEDESLEMRVEDTLGFGRYDLKINQKYLEEHPEYNCFRDPIDIFDYICQHFDKVVIEEKFIQFQYVWGFTLKKTREIKLELNEQEVDQSKIAHIRIDKLTKQLRQKDIKINELEQKLNKRNIEFQQNIDNCSQKIQAINQSYRKDIEEQRERTSNFQRMLKQCFEKIEEANNINKCIEAFQKRIKVLEQKSQNCSKEISDLSSFATKLQKQQQNEGKNTRQIIQITNDNNAVTIKQLRNQIADKNKKLEQKQMQLSKEILAIKKEMKQVNLVKVQEKIVPVKIQEKIANILAQDYFDNHPNNSHAQFYQLTNAQKSSRLVRIGGNARWLTFVNKTEISPNQKIKFKVKIIKLTNNDVSVGFCTTAGLGNAQSYSSNECIYYWGKSGGQIWKMGGQKQTNLGTSNEGDTVECQADLAGGMMRWWKNGNKLTECEVPLPMKGKSIFFSIIMYYINDSIDLII